MAKKELLYIACFLAALASGCTRDNSCSGLEKKVSEPAISASSTTIKTSVIPEKTEKKKQEKQTAIRKAYQKKKPEIEKEKKLLPVLPAYIEDKKPAEEKTEEKVETGYEAKKSTDVWDMDVDELLKGIDAKNEAEKSAHKEKRKKPEKKPKAEKADYEVEKSTYVAKKPKIEKEKKAKIKVEKEKQEKKVYVEKEKYHQKELKRQISVVNVYQTKKPEKQAMAEREEIEKKAEEARYLEERLEIEKAVDELDRKYDFVDKDEEGNLVLKLDSWMDCTNLPSFEIKDRIIKSINWKSIYEDMTLEQFKEYVESIERYRKQLRGGISYLKK